MVQTAIDFLMTNPYGLAIAGSHYIPYAALAFVVVVVRLLMLRFRRLECALLAAWIILMALEYYQLTMGLRVKFAAGGTWGLVRYFGSFAPLVWIWGAWFLARAWDFFENRCLRFVCRTAVVAVLGWVAVSLNIMQVREAYAEGAIPDVELAAKAAARIIKEDYRGDAKQAERRQTLNEYYTANRPVVFSDFAAVAWLLRGQSEGAIACSGLCPYKDDYLFVRVGSGYGNIERIDPKLYDYIARVPGRGTEWRLFRRKTTPHK